MDESVIVTIENSPCGLKRFELLHRYNYQKYTLTKVNRIEKITYSGKKN